jgi:hypothetical protein
MKPRHLLLGAALAVAAGVAVFGDNSPDGAVLGPAPRAAPSPPRRRASAGAQRQRSRLQPRATLIGDGGAARRLRRAGLDPAAAAAAPRRRCSNRGAAAAVHLHRQAAANGQWEVFPARSETIIVRRTTIDGAWRVDSIAPPSVTFTYLPLNQVQQLNIGVFD